MKKLKKDNYALIHFPSPYLLIAMSIKRMAKKSFRDIPAETNVAKGVIVSK